MKLKIKINNIIDYILIILLVLLSIQKGGFYKTDILNFSIGISIISFIYILIKFFYDIKNKKYKIDFMAVLLLILPFIYMLPILFKNYSDLNDSIFELIRYINLFFIYKIVKNSNNKRLYINTIVIITLIQCILSIDAISCRILNDFLEKIGSGYLNIDIIRMSGTIQYANVLAIMCLISIVFVNSNLKIENKIDYIKVCIELFILISTLILTGSRAVMILMVIYYIIYFIKYKKNIYINVITYIPLLILIGIYTSVIYNNIMENTSAIYAIFLIFSFICTLLYYAIFIISKKSIDYNFVKNVNLKYLILFVLAVIAFYFILALNLNADIKISANSNQNVESIILNNIKKDTNSIRFKVKTNGSDTRYSIILNSVDDNKVEKSIKSFNYYDNISGNFDYNFELNDNVKYLKLYIKCEKGTIGISDVFLNEKKQKINYILIPRNLIYRINDLLSGSTSLTDRIIYSKDACKIITKTPLNFIVGTGGEGFNNLYEQVKRINYHSSEVHNSFLQIFVESGIFGFMCIMLVLIYSILKSNNGYIKLAYVFFVIHSIIDLNFSYMSMIAVFGVLLGILDLKSQVDISKFNYILIFLITLVYSLFLSYVVIRANIAFYMPIPSFSEEDIDLAKQVEIVNLNEKRVKYDPYEYIYRKSLDEAYNTYLILLKRNLKETKEDDSKKVIQDEISNVLNNILVNSNSIITNNKTNKNQILYVCSVYFKNIDNFSRLNYYYNIKEGYEYYFDFIISKISFLEKIYSSNDEILKVLKSTKEEYVNKYNLRIYEI